MNRISYKILFLLVLAFLSGQAFAQEEEDKDDFTKEFETFRNDITDDFNAFKDKNDSLFISFLEGAWKEFKLFKSEKPEKPKPEEQPVWDGEENESRELTPVQEKEIKQKTTPPGKSSGPGGETGNSPKETSSSFLSVNVDFFGSLVNIPLLIDDDRPLSKGITNTNDIADYYKKLSMSSEVANMLNVIYNEASERKLNGWGIIQLLEHVSDEFFPARCDQVLFIWYGLLQHGTDARVGLAGDRVILFAHTDTELYNTSYITFNDKNYYLLDLFRDAAELSSISTYDADYPETLSQLNLMFTETPVLRSKGFVRTFQSEEKPFRLIADNVLVDFYSTYPDCSLEVYFSAPLSEAAIGSWDKALGDEFAGWSNIQKVNRLLYIIQHGFLYSLDEKQFGKEKYMFADEAIYYPFTDCEDRAVLLAQLVKHYTGLPVVGLDFPEHVAIGVAFDDELQGDFVNYSGEKYYVCDPTYVGANIGMCMGDTIVLNTIILSPL
ncbi:MAG: hypothetical protein RQ761_12065 [Bacteroidales bacterium]|nr:hypothetical protein [Bacteroidales bacterium]